MATNEPDPLAIDTRAGNEQLRHALAQAGITGEQLAELVGVDPRSVRRWLAGITPRARQQTRIASALNANRYDLWPQPATEPEEAEEQVTAYATADELHAPSWKTLMRDATEQIDLYGDRLAPILGTPGVPELLADKAIQGCPTRILVAHAGSYLEPLLDTPGIEIRVLEASANHTTYLFDDQLLVITPLRQDDHLEPPLFHVQRPESGVLFDRYAENFEHHWQHLSQPIDPDIDVLHGDEPDEPEPLGSVEPISRGQPPISDQSEASSAPRPRRWPGRSA